MKAPLSALAGKRTHRPTGKAGNGHLSARKHRLAHVGLGEPPRSWRKQHGHPVNMTANRERAKGQPTEDRKNAVQQHSQKRQVTVTPQAITERQVMGHTLQNENASGSTPPANPETYNELKLRQKLLSIHVQLQDCASKTAPGPVKDAILLAASNLPFPPTTQSAALQQA